MFRSNLIALLEDAVERCPRHIALIDGERQLSYSDLHTEVARTSRLLRQMGVSRRERVGIHLPKSAEEVVATLAVSAAHAVFVNINYQWTIEQLLHITRDAGISVLITDERCAQRLEEVGGLEGPRRLVVVGQPSRRSNAIAWSDRPSGGETLCRPLGNDLAALLYTSGSTGRPKGVVIPHGTLVRGAEIVATYLQNTSDDRVLSVPPLSFDYGLNQLTTMLHVGGILVLQRVPLPAEIARTAVSEKVTGIPLVAPSWIQLARYLQDESIKFPALRYVTNTGGAIPMPILNALPTLLPGVEIYLMYGLTEAFRSTFLPPALYSSKMGAIGKAIPNVEIFVVHPETGVCGTDEIGELVHRGDLISLGYWGQSEATAQRIRVNEHLRTFLGDEPVLHSGDWVRRDADGILWYVGRMDSMIKSSGFRISPTEVEETVCRFENVDNAVAFGIPDDELGQTVQVAVEWGRNGLDDHGLMKFLRARLPHYMIPRRTYAYVKPMPRTATGKIDRQAVIKFCIGDHTEHTPKSG